MISGIHFKNYKSFPNLDFNLSKSKNVPQNLVAIYGENGSGKSNIVDSIEILRLSVTTLNYHNEFIEIQRIISEKENERSNMPLPQISKVMEKFSFSSLKKLFKNAKTINSQGNLQITYYLLIDNKPAEYLIEYDGEKLVREQLKYTIEKRMGVLFDILVKEDEQIILIHLNDTIFNRSVQKDLRLEINKFWGLHTFFAILNVYIENLNAQYIEESISENLLKVLMFFGSICVSSNRASTSSSSMLRELNSGNIEASELKKLEKNESILYKFFSSLYTDIKDVYYKKTEDSKDGTIEYKLFLSKNIGGNLLEIPFELESSGTKKLLDLLPMFMDAVDGQTVIIDEIDQGIHDVLMNNIIESIKDDVKGQLIFTTHDTYLLQKINTNSAYFIAIDANGDKQIKNIREYKDVRIFKNNNVQLQYLSGSFEAIPYPMSLDFEDLNYELNEEDGS